MSRAGSKRNQWYYDFVRVPWPLLLAPLIGLSSGCAYTRLFYYNDPTLAAPTYFDNRVVHAAPEPTPIPTTPREARLELTPAERRRFHSFDELLESQRTRAFVVIHDDEVVYERYFDGVTASTLLPSFSMSKTYAAVLVGRALQQGLLPSLEVPVTAYIPELRDQDGYADVKLDYLLRMTSGIGFDEASLAGPLLYYATDLHHFMYSYDVEWNPGTHYLYGSINVLLLWDVLHRKLRGDTVAHYFETEVWAPFGATHDASWSLDSETSGVEKLFAGFNATARDHARLGLLFLHDGIIGGHRFLPSSWIATSLTRDPIAGLVHTTDGWVSRGKYQWFLTRDGRSYFAKGYEGQYVFVIPSRHTVIVRFGEGYGTTDWPALFLRVADSL